MNISGVGAMGGNLPVTRQSGSVGQQPTQSPASRIQIPQDSLEISETAQMMADLQALEGSSPERAELIARIQNEIAQGTYDTDEKLEMAFMKFVQQAGND